MSAINLSKLLTSEEQLNNPDRVVATISHVNNKFTARCVLHTQTDEQIKYAYEWKQILGKMTVKEFKQFYPNQYLSCNICGSQQGLRYDKETDRVY